MPAAWALPTLASVSSNATTSAPPASSALALARPDAPRPNSATFLPANVVTGIISFLAPARRDAAPGSLVRPFAFSSQLQRRKADEREHDRDDPEADHDLRFGPALLLEMVVQRRHPEYALAGELERSHLHDHRDHFEHEQSAHHGEHDLMLGRDGDRADHAAKRERAGIAHEDRGGRRIEP